MTDKTRNVLLVILLIGMSGWYVSDSHNRVANAHQWDLADSRDRARWAAAAVESAKDASLQNAEIIANSVYASGCATPSVRFQTWSEEDAEIKAESDVFKVKR